MKENEQDEVLGATNHVSSARVIKPMGRCRGSGFPTAVESHRLNGLDPRALFLLLALEVVHSTCQVFVRGQHFSETDKRVMTILTYRARRADESMATPSSARQPPAPRRAGKTLQRLHRSPSADNKDFDAFGI